MEKQDEETLLDNEDFIAAGSHTREDEPKEEAMQEEEQEGDEQEESTNEAASARQTHTPQSSPYGIPQSSSFPRFSHERTPLMRPSPSFAGLYGASWSTRVGPSPYTADNKPNRRPFHHAVATSESVHTQTPPNTTSGDTLLYNRYRYYSRLRADVSPSEQALVSTLSRTTLCLQSFSCRTFPAMCLTQTASRPLTSPC
ncbi:hypothetical protein GWK47_011796 [Chionoecetes opilio]|uniref:Uncharacterized protein n=1 Tax=Chionoecetes opilio TaxID=41210 RepID=A0A8J5CMV9_CHIOP|nr:hypothetical protein GWK47_011796 [Chionoecetes opilio]